MNKTRTTNEVILQNKLDKLSDANFKLNFEKEELLIRVKELEKHKEQMTEVNDAWCEQKQIIIKRIVLENKRLSELYDEPIQNN